MEKRNPLCSRTLLEFYSIMVFSQVDQILEEERSCPTVCYRPNKSLAAAKLFSLLSRVDTQEKSVQENPRDFEFNSVNYELLSSLLARFDAPTRAAVPSYLLSRIGSMQALRKASLSTYPKWNSYVSELPLIGEFLVRIGSRSELVDALAGAKPTPGVILLLLQLQNLVSFNWGILTDDELDRLAQSARSLRAAARETMVKQGKLRTVLTVGADKVSVFSVARDTLAACDDLGELCRKARFFILKGALLSGANLEVNQDKGAVASYLERLGFSSKLIESLDHADRLQLSPSPFDLKSSMGHLRSFVENLHLQACERIVTQDSSASHRKWGETVTLLRQRDVLTKAEEGFVTGLYTLISDEAVHPLIAESEYARLSRNVVIEYGLLLLRKLDKLAL